MTLKEEYYNHVLEKEVSDASAKRILFEIVSDITNRHGFRQAWEEIDEDIQEEILETWLAIIQGLS